MLINQNTMRSLYTGFNAAFQGGFSGVEPMYNRVATTVPSTTKSNEYGWLGQMPRVREWIGDRVVNSITAHGYTIKNRKFESTISVQADDIEDDNIGIYAPLFTEFGRSAATFPDELVWPFLKTGFDVLCYDGQPFFHSDHPVLDEKGKTITVSNNGGGTGKPWFLIDNTRAILPVIYQLRKSMNEIVRKDTETDDNVFDKDEYVYGIKGRGNVGFSFWQLAYGSKQPLTAANYETARAAMGEFKGDHGRPLGIQPKLLVVPPSLEGAANKILKNALSEGGGTNEWAGTAEVFVCPWLA